MTKAALLAQQLAPLVLAEGMKAIEAANLAALHFDVIGGAMCVMHDDGSVNIIENQGRGVLTCEVMSAENILKVLRHYRPFKDVFKDGLQ